MLVTQSCLTLCDPMDCSLPGSSVYGILQARILEWVAILFSRGHFWPRDWTWVSCIAGRFFTIWGWLSKQSLNDHSIATMVYLVAQLVKNLPAFQETLVRLLGWGDLLEKGWATHSSILGLPKFNMHKIMILALMKLWWNTPKFILMCQWVINFSNAPK